MGSGKGRGEVIIREDFWGLKGLGIGEYFLFFYFYNFYLFLFS